MASQQLRLVLFGCAVAATLLQVALQQVVPDSEADAFVLGVVLHLLLVAAITLAVAGAVDWIVEHRLRRAGVANQVREARRAGREVHPFRVISAVRDGAGDVAEVADVVDVHLHVARKMLDTLVAEGRLVLEEGLYVLPPTPERVTVQAGQPRWIDADEG